MLDFCKRIKNLSETKIMKLHRWIAFNSAGRRIGQEHPRAKFTDRDVEMAIQLSYEGFSLSEISLNLEIPKSTICRWLSGESRGQAVARWMRGEYGTQKGAGNA